MKNPWTKKNPFLSLWLSGANSVANKARVQAAAAGKRQATTFWTSLLTPKPVAKKKARKTRR